MVDLSCYHHDPSSHEVLVSFAPPLESLRKKRRVSEKSTRNAPENVAESIMVRLTPIFGHSYRSGPSKLADGGTLRAD